MNETRFYGIFRVFFPYSQSRAFEKPLLTTFLKACEALVLSHLSACIGSLSRGAGEGVEATERTEL